MATQNQFFIVMSPVLWLLLTPSHKVVLVVVLCFGPGFSSPESQLVALNMEGNCNCPVKLGLQDKPNELNSRRGFIFLRLKSTKSMLYLRILP